MKRLIKSLGKAGFDILSWDLYNGDETVSSSQMVNTNIQGADEPDGFIDIVGMYHKFINSRNKEAFELL